MKVSGCQIITLSGQLDTLIPPRSQFRGPLEIPAQSFEGRSHALQGVVSHVAGWRLLLQGWEAGRLGVRIDGESPTSCNPLPARRVPTVLDAGRETAGR